MRQVLFSLPDIAGSIASSPHVGVVQARLDAGGKEPFLNNQKTPNQSSRPLRRSAARISFAHPERIVFQVFPCS